MAGDRRHDRLERRAQSNYGATVSHPAIREEVSSGFVAATGNMHIEIWKSKGLRSTRQGSESDLEQILTGTRRALVSEHWV